MALGMSEVTPKGWKKEVSSGPRLVFGAGMATSHGDGTIGQQHVPAVRKLLRGKHEAHLPPDTRQWLPHSRVVVQTPSMAVCIVVLLTHGGTGLEPTSPAPTVKQFGQSSRSWMILRK